MKEIIVGTNEAGQRMEKLLKKYLKEASSGFLYKMMRKKNITLNKQKAQGKEILKVGDTIQIFFSEETLEKFKGSSADSFPETKETNSFQEKIREYEKAYSSLTGITLIYENEHLLLVNKPRGILSQKGETGDFSLNEWFIGYLLQEKKITPKQLETYRPSICNRLDRNTSGLVICGKSLYGTKLVNQWIKERKIKKYYCCFLTGELKEEVRLKGYLKKDEKLNKVFISQHKQEDNTYIETCVSPLSWGHGITYAQVELITGKTHQIRAHLSSIGYPLLGDVKYQGETPGKKEENLMLPKGQLLHAYRLVFPLTEEMADLSQKEFRAPEPRYFSKVKKYMG